MHTASLLPKCIEIKNTLPSLTVNMEYFPPISMFYKHYISCQHFIYCKAELHFQYLHLSGFNKIACHYLCNFIIQTKVKYETKIYSLLLKQMDDTDVDNDDVDDYHAYDDSNYDDHDNDHYRENNNNDE